MSEKIFEVGYNERLFDNRIRGKFHKARYYWLASKLKSLNYRQDNILELGCFDCKVLDYLPGKFKFYHGFDANWENGLDIAREKFSGFDNIKLTECQSPAEFIVDRKFDIAIAMETLEHIRTIDLEPFIEKIAQSTEGYFLVTVPNEKGIFWLMKYLSKITIYEEKEKYSLADIVNTTLGRIHKVPRNETGHKGFDLKKLLSVLQKHFQLVSIDYLPFASFGSFFNMTIGIVLKANAPANFRPTEDK